MKINKKPFLLCILDGWGIGDDNNRNNAIAQANTPNYDRFCQKYPHSQIQTSGLDVGLPQGQIGNSEVGHMTIGAGRIIFQDLPRINNAIADGSLIQNQDLKNLVIDLKSSNKACHIMGLFSDGGVHAHIEHMTYLAKFLTENEIKVYFHLFLDGRDVAQKSALSFVEAASDLLDNSLVEIATIAGRYYAMDRDNKWDRIDLSSNAILQGNAPRFENARAAIQDSYDNNITDEFVKPCVIGDYVGVGKDDAMIFCNFRADRARQISSKMKESAIFSHALAMTSYSQQLDEFYKILFPTIAVKNSLAEILQQNKLTQLRIAETEKYAHVTFFFSCGKENEFSGEKRLLVKSPNVATYDLKPEMSALEVTQNLVAAINSQEFDFIVVNYANPDMVGHSGVLNSAIDACSIIDEQLGALEETILNNDGQMLITADHGNIEDMVDSKGNPHTSHTTNPVPLILISNDSDKITLKNGGLADLAPTILSLMNIDIAADMTGNNLSLKK